MFLDNIQPIYGEVPTIEHYSCTIDMLGRADLAEMIYDMFLLLWSTSLKRDSFTFQL